MNRVSSLLEIAQAMDLVARVSTHPHVNADRAKQVMGHLVEAFNDAMGDALEADSSRAKAEQDAVGAALEQQRQEHQQTVESLQGAQRELAEALSKTRAGHAEALIEIQRLQAQVPARQTPVPEQAATGSGS